MKTYLDTNILVFLFQKNLDEIGGVVREIIDDYANILMTSSVCVQELIHLCQIGKVYGDKKRQNVVDAGNVLLWIKEMDIRIVPVNERHLTAFASLPLYDDHRDPNDRLIIAQAMADRVTLVSSDRKFSRYVKCGLDFLFNER